MGKNEMSEQPTRVIGSEDDFEPPEGLDDRYEETIRQTIRILEDDDPPLGIYLAIHRGDGIAFTTGMAPDLIGGVGPTQPAIEMLAQHLSTVHGQTQGMGIQEIALLAADFAEEHIEEGKDV